MKEALAKHKSHKKKELSVGQELWNSDLGEVGNGHILRRARNLFIQNYPYERIYLETGLPYYVWHRKVKSWTKLREKLDEQILLKIRNKTIGKQAEEFVEKGLHIGRRFLDRMLKSGDDMSPKDFKLVMDTVYGMHRVKQLETGAPTDIKAYEMMSPEELAAYLQDVRMLVSRKHGEIIDLPIEERLPHYLPHIKQEEDGLLNES